MSNLPKSLEFTVSEVAQMLYANAQAGISFGMLGSPGLGKSSIAKAVWAALRDLYPYYAEFSVTEKNPIDLGGLYKVVNDKTVRIPSAVIPLDKPVFILIDEFADCLPFEQSGWYRLVLNKCIGDTPLHPGSFVCFASNRPDDGAASRELSNAMKGRVTLATIRADFESTLAYAYANQWNPMVTGFIRAFGRDVIDNGFDPEDIYAGSTPRDFDRLSQLENGGFIATNPRVSLGQIVGNIGAVAGAKYHAFRQIETPDPQLVFDNAETAPVFDKSEIAKTSIYNAAIVGACDGSTAHMGAAIDYALRLDRVCGYGLGWDLKNRFGDKFTGSAHYAKFCVEYSDLICS